MLFYNIIEVHFNKYVTLTLGSDVLSLQIYSQTVEKNVMKFNQKISQYNTIK